MAAAEHRDRYCSDREWSARRRLAVLRRHGRPAPRLLRAGEGSPLQARSGKAGSRHLSGVEFEPNDNDLRGLYQLAGRIGSHCAHALDAEPAGLGQGRHRGHCHMAVVRFRFELSGGVAFRFQHLSPGPPPCSSQRERSGPGLAFSADPARHHCSGRGHRATGEQDPTYQRNSAGRHCLRRDDCVVFECRMAVPDRRRHPRRSGRGVGTPEAPKPGQPADPAGRALRRHRGSDRAVDAGR